MQFKSFGFSFDGKHSSQYSLRIAQVGNGDSTSIFGIQRSIKTEQSGTFTSSLSSIEYSNSSFEITLVKTDGDSIIPFERDEMFEIVEWLFQDDYKVFISDDNRDVMYYAIFKSGSKYENALKQGYLTLQMELNAPCGFSTIQINPLTVQDEITVEIFNKSNLETWNYPDVEFHSYAGGLLEIENLTTGEVMAFDNLKAGCHVYCYNEDLKQFQCLNDPNYNVRHCFNKTWLRLVKGRNEIRIKATHAQVRIIGQTKVAFM